MEVDSEQALLDALVPFEDGLILSCGRARATFLPSVWEQLPDPAEFVAHLKRKAGWPADFGLIRCAANVIVPFRSAHHIHPVGALIPEIPGVVPLVFTHRFPKRKQVIKRPKTSSMTIEPICMRLGVLWWQENRE